MTDFTNWPNGTESHHVLEGFQFENGQQLDELKLRYLTAGTPKRDETDNIQNAILLLHTTTSSADIWFQASLADELFGPGQPLDLDHYHVVIPDMIGFGGSSKPSDGLKASFPNYRYVDQVHAVHRLLTEVLKITHLRFIVGISMGGMLTWMWAEMYPDFMDAVVPISCQPGPMSGRNWIQRRISIEAIRNDPDWNGGNYETNPGSYVHTAPSGSLFTRSVVRLQEQAPTRQQADELYEHLVERARNGDANDRLYQLESSMDYDPSPELGKIRVPVLAINFEDDELNPPELGVVEPAVAALTNGRSALVPAGPESMGHLTGQIAKTWVVHLEKFLRSGNS